MSTLGNIGFYYKYIYYFVQCSPRGIWSIESLAWGPTLRCIDTNKNRVLLWTCPTGHRNMSCKFICHQHTQCTQLSQSWRELRECEQELGWFCCWLEGCFGFPLPFATWDSSFCNCPAAVTTAATAWATGKVDNTFEMCQEFSWPCNKLPKAVAITCGCNYGSILITTDQKIVRRVSCKCVWLSSFQIKQFSRDFSKAKSIKYMK